MSMINIASVNPAKIEAVKEVLEDYAFLHPLDLKYLVVSSGVSEQPIGLGQISMGARFRAENSFSNCDYSIGLESGLINIPYSGLFADMCACSVYDGERHYIGFSEGFRIPDNIVKIVLEENLDLSEATKKAGLTNEEKIGNGKGIINILSGGRFLREEQIKRSLQMALIELENPGFYR